MKETTCSKCNNIQKVGKINSCSYCYHPFSPPNDRILSSMEDKLSDEQILEVLSLEKEIGKQSNTLFFIKSGLFFSTSLLLIFIDLKLFSIFISESFFIFIALICSIITTYFSYRYLSKFFYLDDIASSLFYKTRSGRETTRFEQMFSLFFALYFLNSFFNYFAIYAINDFSSVIAPSRTHQVLISKEAKRVKGGYQYYLNVTNWKKNNDTHIKLKTNKSEWDKYEEQKSTTIKTKRGIFEDVIWSIKQ